MHLTSSIPFIWTFIVIQSDSAHAFLIPPSPPASFPAPIVERDVNVIAAPAIVQQNVAANPPLPILEIGYEHIISQIGENITLVESQSTTNDRRHSGISKVVSLSVALAQCGPGTPCVDGSCCNSVGKCGFKPYNCKTTGTTTCISNCEAQANCGVDSLNGAQKCPLNTCCSYFGYCGTTDVFCKGATTHHPNAPDTTLPCQKGFGSCEVAQKPSCKAGDRSASRGRKVAYWQAGNVQWRSCDKVWASQIDTTVLTHLIFAFASIDPKTFKVVPVDPRTDIPLYSQFTALRSTVLKTWIAVGGGGLNDAGAPTIHAWSDMASSAESRAVFISSLTNFMNRYGFQGVDLDWETPVLAYRGGRQADFGNIVLLVKEMRSAFGKRYGISIAIPTDFSALSQFDLIAMQPYLDFFNFMAYDIHGPWEAARLGAHVLPQASIQDIESRIVPLWFDGIEPSKVNLGLPYYGRGYTLSNTSCVDAGCPYTSTSAPGPCTHSEGIMSLKEILDLIKQKHLEPKLISDTFQKQITYDGNQWMAYDDAETLAMKEIWADQNCLGGTVAWTVDFVGGSGKLVIGSFPMSFKH
ncbi:glycoside hydrolase superfamily [Amylocarpus encephaloides]|uniref:chitinase n=1 Tax=Amylocarpus encephaloides TaxID=45428 RepID=A0A9P8BZA8_9HELO|nr:glycoside hydrolase superfamily [Amylocarpus encephaloides]